MGLWVGGLKKKRPLLSLPWNLTSAIKVQQVGLGVGSGEHSLPGGQREPVPVPTHGFSYATGERKRIRETKKSNWG